jgi:hypothetical protein
MLIALKCCETIATLEPCDAIVPAVLERYETIIAPRPCNTITMPIAPERCEAITTPEPCDTIATLITLECYEIIIAP